LHALRYVDALDCADIISEWHDHDRTVPISFQICGAALSARQRSMGSTLSEEVLAMRSDSVVRRQVRWTSLTAQITTHLTTCRTVASSHGSLFRPEWP
jgi:hypothetical protein